MKYTSGLFFLALLLPFCALAERVTSTAEIFETEYGHQAVGWLDRGAEVWLEEEPGKGSRVRVYVKAWVKRKDMSRSTAKPNAILHDRDGNPIGGIYVERPTSHDGSSSFSTHVIILRGYIFKDRIDPKSNPEKELLKILDAKKSKVDSADIAPYLASFKYRPVLDTLGFQFFQLDGKDGPRIRLAFKENRLVAILPENNLKPRYFEAELRQGKLHVIYLDKLSSEEETFFGEYFREVTETPPE